MGAVPQIWFGKHGERSDADSPPQSAGAGNQVVSFKHRDRHVHEQRLNDRKEFESPSTGRTTGEEHDMWTTTRAERAFFSVVSSSSQRNRTKFEAELALMGKPG